nr:MurR/RpiR family transcriptional regulator [Enterococcus cecorum]
MFLLDKLQATNNLTANEQRIASFILGHIDEVPQMTIEDLAKKTYTSHSAIVRLAKKLDYDGFKEFKAEIVEIVYRNLHKIDNVNANFPFERGDNSEVIAKKMATLYTETIQRTVVQLNYSLMEQMAKVLLKAKRIFIFAQGDTQIRCRGFQNKLMKINKFPIIGEEYADEDWVAANVTAEDCVLILSYSGRIKQYERFLQLFHDNKITSMLITGNAKGALNQLADYVQVITQTEYDFWKIGTFSSQIAFQYVLDTLFSIMYSQNYQNNVVNLKNKYQLLKKGQLAGENPAENEQLNE